MRIHFVEKVLILLPLTHTAHAIRAVSFGTIPEISAYLMLAGIGGAVLILRF